MSCAYLRLNKVICGYFTAYWSQCVFLLVLNVLSRTDYDRNTAVRFWKQSHNAWFASHWQPISQCYIRSKRRMAHRPPGFRDEGDFSPLTHATAQCHLKYVFRNSQYPLCSSQFGSLYLYFPLCFPSKTSRTVQILDAFLLEYHLKPEWSDEWGQAGRLWWVTHISAHFSFFCCVTVKVAVCSADGGASDLELTRLSALPTISLPSLQESAGFVLASCSCNIKTKTELHALSHPLVMDCNKFQ